MAETCSVEKRLAEIVEVDKSYFGPRRDKGKSGRGAGRRTSVFGISNRNKKVNTELVPDCSKAVLSAAIRSKASLNKHQLF